MRRLFGRGGCETHRSVLLEFAARTATGPRVGPALGHVERCRACRDELATTTLVLHGLRQLHVEALAAEPGADGWLRLRSRLAMRRREPSRLLSGMPGTVLAMGLCAALVWPGAILAGGRPRVYNEAPLVAPAPYVAFEASRERARAAGLLPDPELRPSYLGFRIAPPSLSADLPPSMERRAPWVEEASPPVVVLVAAVSGTDTTHDGVARR